MRLIDADALREFLIRAGRFLKAQDDHRSAAHAVGKIVDHLDRMPTVDAMPVVRCQDCKYRYVDGDNVRFNLCLLNHNKVQSDDWYCADGECEGVDEDERSKELS